jgi:nitrate/nitrite transport system ATP-binding protein
MEVWSRTKVTAICVTHDVDEAILLADRVVMMTNGPQATIGKIVDVDLPRPRSRKALLEHPDYYHYREQVLDFLEEYEHGAKGKSETEAKAKSEKSDKQAA